MGSTSRVGSAPLENRRQGAKAVRIRERPFGTRAKVSWHELSQESSEGAASVFNSCHNSCQNMCKKTVIRLYLACS
jgi:hypothetical protein